MGRKGESIFKRSDGRFEGRYIKEYKDGKAIYGYVYARTYNKCKKKKNMQLIAKKEDKTPIIKSSKTNFIHLFISKNINYYRLIKNEIISKF